MLIVEKAKNGFIVTMDDENEHISANIGGISVETDLTETVLVFTKTDQVIQAVKDYLYREGRAALEASKSSSDPDVDDLLAEKTEARAQPVQDMIGAE